MKEVESLIEESKKAIADNSSDQNSGSSEDGNSDGDDR